MKIYYLGGSQAGMIGALACMVKHKIIGAVSYYRPLTEMFNGFDVPLCKSVYAKKFERSYVEADLVLSVHGREIMKFPPEGAPCPMVNIHPYYYSYKGKSPVTRAIRDVNWKASVASHYMTDKVDCGKVIIERFMTVEGGTEREIYNQLYPLYIKVILETLSKMWG